MDGQKFLATRKIVAGVSCLSLARYTVQNTSQLLQDDAGLIVYTRQDNLLRHDLTKNIDSPLKINRHQFNRFIKI